MVAVVRDGRLSEEESEASFMVPPVDPLRGLVISGYGERKDPVTGEDNMPHEAVDILADNVYAAHDGVVVAITDSNSTRTVGGRDYRVGGDTCIDLQMEQESRLDVRTRYCCVSPDVGVGEHVTAGELIGEVRSPCTEGVSLDGARRPYLHFMLEIDDGNGYAPVNPLDPMPGESSGR
jgi:murein DD-endopeptidase MepM/ murein hydrolase activator NlpD